jgi:hypothetical protein
MTIQGFLQSNLRLQLIKLVNYLASIAWRSTDGIKFTPLGLRLWRCCVSLIP